MPLSITAPLASLTVYAPECQAMSPDAETPTVSPSSGASVMPAALAAALCSAIIARIASRPVAAGAPGDMTTASSA